MENNIRGKYLGSYKLGKEHEKLLTELAKKENRPKTFILRKALELYANRFQKKQ